MAGLHLVTGYSGTPHITAADQGVLNAMSVGVDDYVFTKGRQFEAQIMSNNSVRIYDGSLIMNGRQVNLDSGSYLDASISNGASGMNRHDIIGLQYYRDITSGVESVSLSVKKGTASADTPTDPANEMSASILTNPTFHFMPLYRVVLNGLTIERVEPLFRVLAPMADIQHGFYKQNMLINGDFNVNQRGNKTYDPDDTSMYTVDMWRAYKVKVQVLNEGVKLTGKSNDDAAPGFFTQFIQLGKLETTTYTISAMVDDKICTFTVTPGGSAKEKVFEKFKISALTVSTWDNDLPDFNYYDNKLKINICPLGTNTFTIKYIDVFEGTVAYPHVKEDPATALVRCRRYVQKGTFFSPILNAEKSGTDTGYKYTFGIPIENMAKTPTLEEGSWFFNGDAAPGETCSGGVSELTTYYSSGRELQLTTRAMNAGLTSYVTGIRIRYTLTCEPTNA